MVQVGRSQNRIRGFDSAEIEYQQLRPLGAAQYGGASVGEVMFVTNAVTEDDVQSWVSRFQALADRTLDLAQRAARAGHGVSAGDHYLRASTYYRSAEYYADPAGDARSLGLSSRQAFVNALPHMNHAADAIEIPYDGGVLPGYWVRPRGVSGKIKTVVMLSGSDGTSEEIYFFMGRGAIERGYGVLLVDGPGQVGAFRLNQNLHFRPDYEVPLGAAIDVALEKCQADPGRLALFGVSFGGYFVARAAARDHRVKAVISDSPLCDVGPVISAILGDIPRKAGHDVLLGDIDSLPADVIGVYSRNALKSHIMRFGAASAADFLNKANEYVLNVELLKGIICPSLVLGSAGEGETFKTQCDFYARSVSGPVTRFEFGADQGGDAHCQMGNAQLLCSVAYDWLDGLFK